MPESERPERYVEGDDIRKLWERRIRRFEKSRARIAFCKKLRRGEIGVVLPKGGAYSDEELVRTLAVRHPIKKTLGMRMRAVLSEQVARIVREPLSESLQGKKAATDLETWANAVVDELVDNGVLMGKGLEDGEFAVIFVPSPADWRRAPDWATTVERGGEEAREPDARWDRDGRGRAKGEEGYGKRSEKESRKAYEQARSDYLARRLPFVVRVEPASSCVPILTRGSGRDRWETIGLVCRTLYEREELIRKNYRWRDMDRVELIPQDSGTDNYYGDGGQVYLYEYFGLTEDGDPYYATCVGGMKTWRRDGDDEVEAVINLREEFGLSRLPAIYLYANTTDDDDPDELGVPLLEPVGGAILNVETNLTHELLYGRRTAFPGFAVEINDQLPSEVWLDAENNLKEFEVPSEGGVMLLPGRITPMVAPRTGDSVRYVTQHLLGEIEQAVPEAPGERKGASSAQDVVQKTYFDTAQSMVRAAAARARQFVGEMAVECACAAARGEWRALGGRGHAIPVYANVEVTPGGDTEATATRALIEFKERWVGPDIYDLRIEYPKIGNLAEVQQTADLADRGYATFEDVMEARGKTAPEVELARITAQKILTKSPEGQLALLALALKLQGNREEAERVKAELQGRLSPGVPAQGIRPMPTAQLARTGGGPPMGGVQLPNMAASSLYGQVGGQMGSQWQMANAQLQSEVAPGAPRPMPNGMGG